MATFNLGDNVTGELVDGVLTISGTGDMTDFSWNGSPVYQNTDIISIIIEDGVTNIGDWAFYGCSSLTSVTIPDSMTSIRVSAFWGCSSLLSITIPDSVTSIGDLAFYGCSSLTSLVIGSGVVSIGMDAFYDCSNLTSVVIPDSVTSIGNLAFGNCSSLTSLVIGSGVASIGNLTFRNTYLLSEITNLYEGNQTVGSNTFLDAGRDASIKTAYAYTSNTDFISAVQTEGYTVSHIQIFTLGTNVTGELVGGVLTISGTGDMTNFVWWAAPLNSNTDITSVIIEEGVTSIGDNAFYGCSSLTSITIPNSVTSIGESAFSDCSSLTSITIPDSVTSIGDHAFWGCSSLTSVVIPDDVTSIGFGAFADCSSLTSVTIGNGVTSIGDHAFGFCSSLTSVTIPDSVTSIGNRAFQGCSSLTSITIPDSVTSIGDGAFEYCTSLSEITNRYSGNQTLGFDVFFYAGTNATTKTAYAFPSNTNFISEVEARGYAVEHLYPPLTLKVSTPGGVVALATLDETGNVPATQLGNVDGMEVHDNTYHTEDYATETALSSHNTQHQNGGADEINLAGLQGESAELTAHKAKAVTDAHDPLFKNYREEVDIETISGTAHTINLESGNVHVLTLTANCTLSITNAPPNGTAGSFTLILKQDSTPRAVTWDASIKWSDDEVPEVPTANKVGVYAFITTDGGNRWYGFQSGNEMVI